MRIKKLVQMAAIATAMTLGSTAAWSVMIPLEAIVEGAQEVPPVASMSKAFADLLYDTDAMELSWKIGPVVPAFISSVRFSHFHGPAGPGANAGVELWICDDTGNGPPGTDPCGAPGNPFAMGSAMLTQPQEDDLLAGLYYINIHTDRVPSGEIRGQVLRVVEPETVVLLGLGVSLLVVGAGARRRKRG